MHLTISPVRGLPGQPETALEVQGDTLIVDGQPYDLSAVPENGEGIPQGTGHPFLHAITRTEGRICCTVRVFLGDDAAHDQPQSPWVITADAGPVALPIAYTATGEASA